MKKIFRALALNFKTQSLRLFTSAAGTGMRGKKGALLWRGTLL
jgi:hypothetical protein